MRSRRLWEIRERVLRVLGELSAKLGADVYLFGSYARGDHLLDSDVDVLVVSERFEGMRYVDRVALVRSMLPGDLGFDVVALTPRELARGGAFVREISRHWIKVERTGRDGLSRPSPEAGTS